MLFSKKIENCKIKVKKKCYNKKYIELNNKSYQPSQIKISKFRNYAKIINPNYNI
jgi:hypothetical protein